MSESDRKIFCTNTTLVFNNLLVASRDLFGVPMALTILNFTKYIFSALVC
jgi:hypothetical protein